MTGFGPLVSSRWLAAHIADPDLVLVDFRWYLTGRRGADEYAAGHIPGAVFVDLDAVSGRPGNPGRHPLPAPSDFTAAMRAAGVGRRSRVVVYDDVSGSVAARLWWLLRHFGHEEAAVLDGGLPAWEGPLTVEIPIPVPGDFEAGPGVGDTVDHEAVGDRPEGTVLIDARAGERYRGESEPVDPRAGHIPGAHSAPWSGNVGPDGRLLAPDELRRRFAALGIHQGTPAVAYCGSGVNACHALLALEVAGLPGARLYEGSWSDWSSRPELPAATGAEPGA